MPSIVAAFQVVNNVEFFLLQLSERQHFIDNSYMYSMEDLVQTQSGVLTTELVKIHGLYAKHIKLDCMVGRPFQNVPFVLVLNT